MKMWIELFKNTNGKFSSSGFIGVVLGMVAATSFVAAMVGYFLEIPNTVEIMGEMLKLVAASTVLLGVRKMRPVFGQMEEARQKRKEDRKNREEDREEERKDERDV